jgi:hypothetical protein
MSDQVLPVSSEAGTVGSPSGSVQQKSYAAVVTKRPSLKKDEYEVSVQDGVPTIAVPKEVITESVPLWDDFLVGRFPSQAPHVAKIHVIVNKIWTLGDKAIKIDVYEIDSTSVKFRIRDSATRSRIVRRGMWNIAGLPMIVAKWSPIKEEAQPEIKTMPLWVTVKNVPHSMFSWDGLSFITSSVGNPIRLHPETELCTKFDEAKVFVEVNLSQDVPKCHRFKIEEEKDVIVEFIYPWLPPKCTCCSKWGHLVDVCVSKLKPPALVIESELEEGEVLADPSASATTVRVADHESANSGNKEDGIQNSILISQEVFEQQVVAEKVVPPESQSEGDGWSIVSPGKGSKSTEKSNGKPLTFGQATILSSSRYSVLSDQEENGDKDEFPTISSEEVIETERTNSIDDVVSTQAIEKNSTSDKEKAGAVRVNLPRSSKSSHKVLSESFTQKARDNVSSNSSRRNSKKHH